MSKFEDKAKEFFANQKNNNVNKVYITSDGNVFRAEHYADNWKTNLKDSEVEIHDRVSKVQAIIDDVKDKYFNEADGTKKELQDDNTNTDVRSELEKEYIELFDTKPAHNIGLEKLQDKITAKRLELEKASKSTVIKHIVTEEDLTNNPSLVEQGVNVGDEIEIPAE